MRAIRILIAAFVLMIPAALAHRTLQGSPGTYTSPETKGQRGFDARHDFTHLYSPEWKGKDARVNLAKELETLRELQDGVLHVSDQIDAMSGR